MKAFKHLLLSSCLLASASSSAGLIEFDSYTYDESSNLSWLDLQLTDGYSYNYVESELSTSGLFEGWRFATSSEVTNLIVEHVGFQPDNYYAGNTESSMKSLIDLMGYSYDGRDYSNIHQRYFAFAVGYVDSAALDFAQIRQFGYKSVIGGYYRPENDGQWDRDKDSGISSHASFLVRDGVLDPLPNAQYSISNNSFGPSAPVFDVTTSPLSPLQQVSVPEPKGMMLGLLLLAGLLMVRKHQQRTN